MENLGMRSKCSINVLKARIADCYDYDYIIDMLDISVEMILDAFEDRLIERRDDFSELEGTDYEDST